MTLYIIRGLPGSGKTTRAKEIVSHNTSTLHYEADMYFTNVEGEYVFIPSKIKYAHDWCKSSVESALQKGNSVVVSNTFTQLWEFKPYLELANKYNADIIIEVTKGSYTNIHDVPSDVIERMKTRWEDYTYE